MAEYKESSELHGAEKSSIGWKSADPRRGEPTLDPRSDDMMRFTSTGRPFVPDDPYQSTWAGLANGDVPQGVAPRLLPPKYTNESPISVPCLRPRSEKSVSEDTDEQQKKKKKWWRRKWSIHGNDANDTKNFMIKTMTRGEYLKHYSKDEEGNYTGTEEPAEDCILEGEDLEKYRSGKRTE